MSWLRRRDETRNEKLLREPGYSPDGTELETAAAGELPEQEPEPSPGPPNGSSPDLSPSLGFGPVGNVRERDADAVETVDVPDLTAATYAFITLPDGSMIVDESCDEDLSRFADAVEQQVKRPYRAAAVRQEGTLWIVSAWHLDVVSIAGSGDELELTSVAGERTYAVDGRSADPSLAPGELAALGEARSHDYAVHAVRLEGDLWEVAADPL